MRAIAWLIVACVGFGLMAWSYFSYIDVNQTTPWAKGAMYLAQPGGEGGSLPEGVAAISARARLLPLDEITEAILQFLPEGDVRRQNLRERLSEKLIAVSPADAHISEAVLDEGRLPRAALMRCWPAARQHRRNN